MSILNLTQHAATPDQLTAGVIDLDPARQATLRDLLTVDVEKVSLSYLPDHLDSRVDGILSLIWPELRDGTYNACREAVDLYEIAEDTFAGYNAARGPVLEAMVGGMPALVDRLVKRLRSIRCRPLYALSNRVVVEQAMPDGTVRKTAEFRHVGFIAA
jgi:hypothetical protein